MSGGACARCGGERAVTRRLYCDPCAKESEKEKTRLRDDQRKKPCARCGGPKELHRGARYCGPCREAQKPAWQRAEAERARRRSQTKAKTNPKRQKKWDAPDGTKWCNRCGEYRPLTDFGVQNTKSSGVSAYCIPCSSEYSFERRLNRVFGMTSDDYYRLYEQQGGRCAICANKPRKRRLAVDHDHLTGEIRGLLCTRCNKHLLGAAHESPAMLRRAANYLERPPARTGLSIQDLDHWSETQLEAAIEERLNTGYFRVLHGDEPLVAMRLREMAQHLTAGRNPQCA